MKRAYAETGKDFKHGVNGYIRFKCRCNICLEARANYHRAWRQSASGRKKTTDYRKSESGYARKREERWRRQGIDLRWEDYQAMHTRQAGQCAVCQDPIRLRLGDPGAVACADHDHTTGKVRGLLCPSCNKALGHLKDSPQIIGRLLAYLTPSGTP